jgi:hypothetical protein
VAQKLMSTVSRQISKKYSSQSCGTNRQFEARFAVFFRRLLAASYFLKCACATGTLNRVRFFDRGLDKCEAFDPIQYKDAVTF